ncbi:hypothetical protein LTR37_003550 [Vermiconidia calcicola]|uniref:Uncharacterized protein n=1 Tax=Vermiconidia calcicola TaxID=1690605 RepID=A0ACC3NPV6_9PEZI|nr:hypothetical protein LTR37_003550 [Vermiconidia calcicola]
MPHGYTYPSIEFPKLEVLERKPRSEDEPKQCEHRFVTTAWLCSRGCGEEAGREFTGTCWPSIGCDIRKPRKETIQQGPHPDPKMVCDKCKPNAQEDAIAMKNRDEDRARHARDKAFAQRVREEDRASRAREKAREEAREKDRARKAREAGQRSQQGQGTGATSGKPRQ